MHRLLAISTLLTTAIVPPAVSATIMTPGPTAGPNAPSASSHAQLPSLTFPPGYTYYPATGSSYKVHRKSFELWDDANTTCAREGADLVVLNDAEEADIVATIMRDAGFYFTWTGLQDNRPGGVTDWRTVHGEPLRDVYNVWRVGEPRDDPQYKCAYFFASEKLLSDWRCGGSLFFTCEISQK